MSNYQALLKDPEFRADLAEAVNLIVDVSHGLAKEGGWWSDLETGQPIKRNKGELYALIHSEISESMEGARKNLMDDKLPSRKMEEVELADAIIRIGDFAGGFDHELGEALAEKMLFNVNRADHKPENRAMENGKKF